MAFNPFHGFRKHQKAVFAVMVIICMFVFILQFGAGDPFTRLLGMFGGSKGKGKHVATLHGTKVYESDLSRLLKRRQIAAGIVGVAAREGMADKKADNPMMTLTDKVAIFGQFRIPPFGSFGRNEELLDFMIWRQQADQLGITLTEADVKKAVNRVAGGKDVFGGKPFATSRLIQDILRDPNARKVVQDMTAKELLEAVTDEFRVLLAKEAVLGVAPGAFGPLPPELQNFVRQITGKIDFSTRPEADVPAITPAEFLQYYREQRATLRVWVLPVKVEDYLAEAKRSKSVPPDKILDDLFQQYKTEEPGPERDRPAFKEPARVKAAWVSAGPDLAYFKEQARLKIELPDALSKLSPQAAVGASIAMQVCSAAASFTAPGSSAPFLAFATAPYTFDRSLAKFADYQQRERDTLLIKQEEGKLKYPLHDRSLSHPAALAFLIGNALSAGTNPAAGAAALPAVSLAWFGPAAWYENAEVQRVTEAQLAMVGTALCPPLGGGINLFPVAGAAYASPSRYGLPWQKDGRLTPLSNDYWQVRDRLREEIRNDEVAAVLDAEMTALSKDVAKSKATPEEAEKKIKEAVKKYDLRSGSMPTALDRFDLEKDEPLKKLRDEYLQSKGGGSPQDFSTFLLGLTAPYEPKEFRKFKGDTYLVWQTELVKAREPRSLAEVRDKVIEAWYFREARSLARKQAEQWSATAKKEKKEGEKVDDIERRLREKAKNDGFVLRKVARLVDETAVQGPRGKVYRRFTVDSDKIEYPRPNLVDLLVKQLTAPGDATVVSDRPERIYYVVVLQERDDLNSDKAMEQFVKDVYEKTPNDDRFWTDYLLPAKRRDYENLVLRQLREDAGAPLKDGEYDLPDIGTPRGDTGGGDVD